MKKISESLESISESLSKIVTYLHEGGKVRPSSDPRAVEIENGVLRMVSENIKDTSLAEAWPFISSKPWL
jgi:hypothetical protein